VNEVELKSVVPDDEESRCHERLARAGARPGFTGTLLDRRYDDTNRSLLARDHVLRMRAYHNAGCNSAALDWKGPTRYESGYKMREEISTTTGDADALATILVRLGFEVTREIDREIAQYELDGATIRFERYPRMDLLVEVEGSPETIERAIGVLGLPRAGFTSERLTDFVRRYELRTGTRAALCARELEGDYRWALENA